LIRAAPYDERRTGELGVGRRRGHDADEHRDGAAREHAKPSPT
jgi:hypothetical protein